LETKVLVVVVLVLLLEVLGILEQAVMVGLPLLTHQQQEMLELALQQAVAEAVLVKAVAMVVLALTEPLEQFMY
jgi:hypothetical protein